MALPFKRMADRIREKFPGAVESAVEGPGDPWLALKGEALLPVCRYLKEDREMRFDLCLSVCGVDDRKDFWVVWHLYSTAKDHRAVLKVRLDRKKPAVPSVTSVWKAADWHERETYDLYGIRFEGHPDLRRILLPEDWPGHPLRKDYDYPDEYRGIPLQ